MYSHNVIGDAFTPANVFTLSSVPDKPSPAPSSDPSLTTTTQIAVLFENTNVDDGGSQITQVELFMDDGMSGAFSSIFVGTSETSYVVSDTIVRGLLYRFKYRVGNTNGWSLFSDTSYIHSYAVPAVPAAPVLLSATDTTALLKFEEA